MPQFKIIRSVMDAYEVAQALLAALADGESVQWSSTTFERRDDAFIVSGYVQGYPVSGTFGEAELADLVLYPDRRKFNDYLRSRLLPEAQAKASDHDAGVISDLSAQLEAAQARAERAEAECAAALTRAESAEGELALCRDDLRTAERDVERAEAALRGGEEGE